MSDTATATDFFVNYGPVRPNGIDDGDNLLDGWRVSWSADKVIYSLGLRFERKLDAELAARALQAKGLTPEKLDAIDNGDEAAWEEISLTCLEALQW